VGCGDKPDILFASAAEIAHDSHDSATQPCAA
jgi:hypothetical protein